MSTLIVYTTKNGCTEKCAKLLAEKLNEKADLINIASQNVPDLSAYQKIIIGSPVRFGQTNKAIRNFCIKNNQVLQQKKLAFFVCCGFTGNTDQYFASGFPAILLNSAVAKESLGGELDINKLKGFDKFVAKTVSKASETEKKDPPALVPENIDKLAQAMNNA